MGGYYWPKRVRCVDLTQTTKPPDASVEFGAGAGFGRVGCDEMVTDLPSLSEK